MSFTFVSAVNDEDIFQNNFMVSPCFRDPHTHQVLAQRNFSSAAKAYNDAITRSVNDLLIFAHQDMVFPNSWISDLERSLKILEVTDPQWGVLGCYGETLNDNGRGYLYSPGRGILGKPFEHPALVQTLDEVVLILRKSSKLKFDNDLPHFHFYGADICMAAAEEGMNSYAISALCIHNSGQLKLVLPKEFYEGYKHVKRRWARFLPIQTTCVRITGFDRYMHQRRIRELYLSIIRKKVVGPTRAQDGRTLLSELERIHPQTAIAAENGRHVCP